MFAVYGLFCVVYVLDVGLTSWFYIMVFDVYIMVYMGYVLFISVFIGCFLLIVSYFCRYIAGILGGLVCDQAVYSVFCGVF